MDENVHPPILASSVDSHHAPQSHTHHWTFPKLFVVGQMWWKHASYQPISLDNCCFKVIPNPFVGCPNFMEWMFISYVQLHHLKTFEPMKVLEHIESTLTNWQQCLRRLVDAYPWRHTFRTSKGKVWSLSGSWVFIHIWYPRHSFCDDHRKFQWHVFTFDIEIAQYPST
jgi:hypothetical protein